MIARVSSGRSAFLIMIFILVSCLAVSATDLPASWRSWRYSRPIEGAGGPGLATISIPIDLYAHLDRGFSDLRIVDESGKEIPYLLYDKNVRAPIETRTATIRENSFVPGQYTQLVIDTGDKITFHNAIEIHTPQTDFINWVEVAASDDAHTWRTVKDRAPISSFTKETIAGSRFVHYSDNNARFLRVRIFEPSRQFPVSSADVLFSRQLLEPVRTPLTTQSTPDPAAPATSSRWVADLGSGSFPISGVTIETSQPEFFRIVRMESSKDGREWQNDFSGQIYRYKKGDKEAESLNVFSNQRWDQRFWRIEVVNGNDAPLSGAKPTLLIMPYFVLFYPQAGHSFRLIYGNSAARPPQYDLSRTFDVHAEPNATVASLGTEQSTGNYLDPRPYTERHRYLLWVALVVAVIVLASAALGTLRAPAKA
jgi:hypothetical protein